MSQKIGFDYRGKFALVTGASKGLRKAYAEELAARGANLILVARTKAALESLAVTLRRERGVRVEVIAADLSDLDAPGHIVDEVARLGIDLDVLLNNAAVGYSGSFYSRPIHEELTPIRVNVHSLVALTHLVGKRMVVRGSGGIINISSECAFQPVPYNATYAATKAFLLMFSEAIAEELKGSGVHVMVANPGATATEFFDQSPTTVKLETMDTAESVAKRLNDFSRGKVVSYPGRRSIRATTWVSRVLPRALTVKLAARFSRRMGFVR
jgi:short-subunit dehydrogenase